MRIVRFVTTSDGGSRFEELDIPFLQPYEDEFGNTYHLTRDFAASAGHCAAPVFVTGTLT